MNFLEMLFGKQTAVISASELNERTKNGKKPFIVDVRQPDEYRAGHIAGSKLIPLGELSKRLNELPKDKEIICVCQSGNRSGSATRTLVGAGFNAVNMQGGIISWRRANFQVKQGSGT